MIGVTLLLSAARPDSVFAMAQNHPIKKSPVKEPVLDDRRLEGFVTAPEFPEDLEWLNTGRPLSIKQLAGKIILLDFWTYCCINCMHVIPDLKRLEEKYSQELVVIGVHSAKFANEKGTESIRQAILRYEIKHPVVNDKDMEVWSQYGVQAWPTSVLINPKGKIIGAHSGEGVYEIFDRIIASAVAHFDSHGELKRSRLQVALEEAQRPQGILFFPGKVHADPAKKRFFISDSNNNRILITTLNGEVLDVIAGGRAGKKDGVFEDAELNHPQGIFADGEALYIADTENHLIRKADLSTRQVQTLFGTGRQAGHFGGAGMGTQVALNSPWDLLAHKGKLYIAMAGSHQLYEADLKSLQFKPFAGSGREARIDGPLLQAALAQPSGITTDGEKLYFADSEVSSVRSADLHPDGKVETLIGEDLFVFGDADGAQKKARLQHPLGVVYHKGMLYVADTYNSKIKIIDPIRKTSESLAGNGNHGSQDGAAGEAEFFEPSGLTILDDHLYVADTNNHAIRILDLASGQVSTLKLRGLQKSPGQNRGEFKGRIIEAPEKKVKQGRVVLSVSFILPSGYKFVDNGPFHLEWKSEESAILKFSGSSNQLDTNRLAFPFEIPIQASPGRETVVLEAVIYYCNKKSKVCLFENLRIRIPIEVGTEGLSRVALKIPVEPKAGV